MYLLAAMPLDISGTFENGGRGRPSTFNYDFIKWWHPPCKKKTTSVSDILRYTETYILLVLYKDILIKCHIHEPKNGDVSSNKTLLSISTDFSHHLVLNLVSKYSNMSQLEVLSRRREVSLGCLLQSLIITFFFIVGLTILGAFIEL